MKDLLNDAMQELIEAMAIYQSLPDMTDATEQAEKWRHDALLSVLGTQLQLLKDTLEEAVDKANA